MFDLELIKNVYANFKSKVEDAKKLLGRPMTYTEKILYAHLWEKPATPYNRGTDFTDFKPVRWLCCNLCQQVCRKLQCHPLFTATI